jgi:Ni,Fe-hydrogenase III small subunit
VVGYASYCQLRDEIVPALADMPGAVPSPVRLIEAIRGETQQSGGADRPRQASESVRWAWCCWARFEW